MTDSTSPRMEQRHRAIVALSFAPALGAAERGALERRACAGLALLCDDDAPRVRQRDGALLILETGAAAPGHADDDGAWAYSVGVGGTDWRQQRACDGAPLLRALRASGAAALAEYAPPFAAVFRRRREAPLEAATDACGLRHLYVTAGPGFAACASSSLVLGALRDDGLDLDALAQYARLGFYGDARTPLRGVRRLLAGEACALRAGTLDVSTWAEAPPRPPRYASFAAAVRAGADAVRAAVGALATAHDHIGISLSGGLDSRLVLAALAPARRAALEVLCIRSPRRDDAPVVERLAALCGFTPTFADVGAFPPADAVRLAERASRWRDHGANPLTVAVLEWAESAMPATPRFHGQNGEFVRGVYYGDMAAAEVTGERVAALFESRRFSGRRVSSRILAPAYVAPIDAALRDDFLRWAHRTGLPWLDVLDEYYLSHFTAGWVGVEFARTSMRRIDLSPYFDPRFVAFARRASPHDKRGSRLMAAVLEALDPALAALPLEQGPSPAELWRAAPASSRPASPPAATPPPRRGGPPHVPVGADLVRAQVIEQTELIEGAVARAAALPLFDAGGLATVLHPDGPSDLLTLGFVLDVAWILEFLDGARRRAAVDHHESA